MSGESEMLQKVENMLKAQWYKKQELDFHIWVFSSVDNCNFNYNSKYLFFYVREQLPQIKPVFVINNTKKRKQLTEEYGHGYFVDGLCSDGMKMILRAGVWFTSAGLPVYEWKGNPERIVVNLWHGIPLKKIVLMEEKQSFLRRFYFKHLFSSKYTYILTTSKHLVPIMSKSFAVPEECIKVWGQPRNDLLWETPVKGEVLRIMEIEEGASLILYAPTYREYGDTVLFPFPDNDQKEIERFLQEKNCHICIRTHLKEQGRIEKYTGSHIHFMNEDVIDDIALWLNCFDVLITDYSSIYLDYLLLNKPIIFLPYDQREYLRKRGMNFPYEKVTPGPKPENLQEFLKCVDRALAGQDGYASMREKCNSYFNQMKEPCSNKICEYILRDIKNKL